MTARNTLIVALVLAAGNPDAQTPKSVQRRGPATLELSAPLKNGHIELSLSDTLEATWKVVGGKRIHVDFPAKLTRSPGWEVLHVKAPDISSSNDGRQTWVMKVTVAPVLIGEQPLQLEPLRIGVDDGPLDIVAWDAIPARISSVVANADVKTLRDRTSIEEPPPPARISAGAWWITGGILGSAVFLAALVAWRRRQRADLTGTTAEQIALRELERIRRMRLPEKNRCQRFYFMLSELVRRYLEKRLHKPVRSQTTAEFVRAVRDSGNLSQADQGFLHEFFRRCDLAKYAGATVSCDECEQ